MCSTKEKEDVGVFFRLPVSQCKPYSPEEVLGMYVHHAEETGGLLFMTTVEVPRTMASRVRKVMFSISNSSFAVEGTVVSYKKLCDLVDIDIVKKNSDPLFSWKKEFDLDYTLPSKLERLTTSGIRTGKVISSFVYCYALSGIHIRDLHESPLVTLNGVAHTSYTNGNGRAFYRLNAQPRDATEDFYRMELEKIRTHENVGVCFKLSETKSRPYSSEEVLGMFKRHASANSGKVLFLSKKLPEPRSISSIMLTARGRDMALEGSVAGVGSLDELLNGVNFMETPVLVHDFAGNPFRLEHTLPKNLEPLVIRYLRTYTSSESPVYWIAVEGLHERSLMGNPVKMKTGKSTLAFRDSSGGCDKSFYIL